MFPDPENVNEALELLTGSLDSPRLTPSQILAVGTLMHTSRGFLALHQAISQPTDEMIEAMATAMFDDTARELRELEVELPGDEYAIHAHVYRQRSRNVFAAVASVLLADERNEQ